MSSNKRYIEVERCSFKTCPHCIPDMYAKNKNYCGAYLRMGFDKAPEISARVKTFPKLCPLKPIKSN